MSLEDKKKKLKKLQCTQESLETYIEKIESLVDDVTTAVDWLDSSVHTDGETFGEESETLYDKVCRLVGIREEVQIEIDELIDLAGERQGEIDDLENEIAEEELSEALPPHLQSKVDAYEKKKQKYSITDVTPSGYGPDDEEEV